jgi:transposase-like protein
MSMTFLDAAKILTAPSTLSMTDLAKRLDVHPHTLYRARIRTKHGRREPADWQQPLARLAREHAARLSRRAEELTELADQLEGEE